MVIIYHHKDHHHQQVECHRIRHCSCYISFKISIIGVPLVLVFATMIIETFIQIPKLVLRKCPSCMYNTTFHIIVPKIPFTLKQATRKRRELGFSAWLFFMNLIKTFVCVPRELLWNILIKFGVPPTISQTSEVST